MLLVALILGFIAIPTSESYEMGQCLNCEQQLNEWCCISSWNGRCCEFPLDHEEEEPQDTAHHSNYFSIQVTTPKPRLNTNFRQFHYKNLFDGFLGHTSVRELPIPKNQKKPYQWWTESK